VTNPQDNELNSTSIHGPFLFSRHATNVHTVENAFQQLNTNVDNATTDSHISAPFLLPLIVVTQLSQNMTHIIDPLMTTNVDNAIADSHLTANVRRPPPT
jgi:hypothetical protein